MEQTLFVRDPSKLSFTLPANAQLIVGDALNPKGLYEAIKGHDIVYANLKRGLAKILALTSRTLTVMYRY
ncbi:NAD(P)H-binding protein [Photobacterium sp. CCB-ST2H9]|uniref:NAD(P)H-binding protein n=1 Tax=Photobacterium sp. CCB-ST2H9 TaxID=2912855 RepID=UPI003532563C